MSPRSLRLWHGYVGAFIAPSVLFFAATGALQLFDLHEAHGSYHPPPIVERLGRVHKDQLFALDDHHGEPADAGADAGVGEKQGPAAHDDMDHDDDRPETVVLKWFFLAVAAGLAMSTSLGIWIALTRPQGRATTLGLMLVGAAVPLLLLAI